MQNTQHPNRKLSPPNNKFEDLYLQNPEKICLDNGLDLYLIESGLEEVVRIDLVVKAGSAFQKKKLCATFTNDLLKEGTNNLSSDKIAHQIDFYGAYLSTSTSKDNAVVTLFAVTKHLKRLLPLFKEIITKAVFPEQEFEIHRDRNRQEFLIKSEKAKIIANREFNKLVFGENTAYGQYLVSTDFDFVNRNDLVNFHKTYYNPENAYLIVSGRPDAESKKLIVKLFGSEWESNKTKPEGVKSIVSRSFSGDILIKKDKFLQSAIRIGKQIIGKNHEDYSYFLFTNTILGGYFGSRLMSNLREDKGMTYGIRSFSSNFKHASYFSIATEVNIKQTSAALSEIKKEIDILQNEKVSDEEISLVKNYIYGNFLKNFDGPFALAEMFRSVMDIDSDFSFFNESLNKIMKVDAEVIQQTAQKYLNLQDMCNLVVGDIE